MMTNLTELVGPNKLKDLHVRIHHDDTKTALAAEAELAVLWSIKQVAHLVPEPAFPGSTRRPDAMSIDLFRTAPAVIEIRAISDDSFSGKEAMDRTANIIADYADQIRKGAGRHLYFEFNERSYWTTRFHRERCVDPAFKLTVEIKDTLFRWIKAPDWPNPVRIRLVHGNTDVVISWQESTVRHFRTFCRMPPIAYDLEDNPVHKALKKKARQLTGAPHGTIRCVVLVDVGCDILRRLRPMGGIEVSGEAIIHHAIQKLRIDVVIVVSPYREQPRVFVPPPPLRWNVQCFDARKNVQPGEYVLVEMMARKLPKPHFEGYQARDRHRQGAFALDCRDWYLPTIMSWNSEKTTLKISAGLLHEYLAGRIDADDFRKQAFNGETNVFDTELSRGRSIRMVAFEPAGLDEDDDYVIVELDTDWDKFVRSTD